MMSTAVKDAKMCEETSIILDGGNVNHTDADCIREAIAVEVKQNTEEELASLSIPAFVNHEDTMMDVEQNGSAEEKEEMYAVNENKREPQHTNEATCKIEVSTTDETEEKGTEVDKPLSSKEMCTMDETVEKNTEAEELLRNVAPSKNDMNTAEESVEKSTETQNLITASSKKEVSTTDEAVNETTVVQNLSAALSKNEMSSPDEAIEDVTEAQNLSVGLSSKEVSTIDESVEERAKVQNLNITPSNNEMSTTDESVGEKTEAQNLSAALSKKEVSTTDEAVEESAELQSLSAPPSKKEASTTDESVEERIETINLSAALSEKEVSTATEAVDEITEGQNLNAGPPKKEMSNTEEAIEKSADAQDLSAAPYKKVVSTADEAVDKMTEAKNLSSDPSKKEVSSTEDDIEERPEAPTVSVEPLKKEVGTVGGEAVEGSTEAQNVSAGLSKKEVSTVNEVVEGRSGTQNVCAKPSEKEVSTIDEAVERRIEAQNLSAGPSSNEVNSTKEVVEGSAKAHHLNTASSRREVNSTEEMTESQILSAGPSKKEMCSTEETLEKSVNGQESSTAPSNKVVSSADEVVDKMVDITLSAGPSKKEVSTIEERPGAQNLNVGASEKQVSTAENAIEEMLEAQNLNAGPSKKVGNTSEEAVAKKRECQKFKVPPSKKGRSRIEEVVKKMIKCRLGVTSTKRKMSPRKAVEERKEADDASVSSYNHEMSFAVEENDPGVCGPSKKACPAARAIEKNKEESKASTSASSSSRHDSDISMLQSIPRNSTPVRRRLINSRRILMNRQARLAEGFNVAFNGKTIAPKHPQVSVPRVHVTAEAFPSLASELYSVLPETFKDAVSLSMMEYYFMILYYHRLAGLRMNERKPLPEDEVLCSNLELGPLFVPDMIEQWITMRGHDINTRGEAIKLILPPIPSDTGDFGRISATTHWRYISDLAPRVFRDRIAADLEHTLCSGPVEWNLPEDLRPEERNCGLPTRNLIGYHVAQRLTASQIDELQLCGIGLWNDKAVFPVDIDAGCYHFNIHLVEAVSQHFAALSSRFRVVRHARYDSQSSSAGLVIYGERMVSETEEYLFDRSTSHYEQHAKVRAYAPIALDKELAKGAVVFLPRVYRRDGKGPINRSWCAYDFGFYFMVPDEWTVTRNNAYKQGSWQIWHTPHLTTASVKRANLLKAVVKHLVLSQKQFS